MKEMSVMSDRGLVECPEVQEQYEGLRDTLYQSCKLGSRLHY